MEVIGLFILFLVASFVGWIMEILYLNLIERKRKNPGFLKGPYLPIYGFAAILLYLIADLNISVIYKIILFIIFPTLIELITGMVFEKYFRMKIWDYSKKKFNFKGIICLESSFYWIALSMLYLFVLHDLFRNYLLTTLSINNYVFFFGIVAGIFLLDEFYALSVAFKIKQTTAKMKEKIINFNEFKNMGNIFNNIKGKIKKIIIEKPQTKKA